MMYVHAQSEHRHRSDFIALMASSTLFCCFITIAMAVESVPGINCCPEQWDCPVWILFHQLNVLSSDVRGVPDRNLVGYVERLGPGSRDAERLGRRRRGGLRRTETGRSVPHLLHHFLIRFSAFWRRKQNCDDRDGIVWQWCKIEKRIADENERAAKKK